jgi:hypothetical protein
LLRFSYFYRWILRTSKQSLTHFIPILRMSSQTGARTPELVLLTNVKYVSRNNYCLSPYTLAHLLLSRLTNRCNYSMFYSPTFSFSLVFLAASRWKMGVCVWMSVVWGFSPLLVWGNVPEHWKILTSREGAWGGVWYRIHIV